MVMCLYYSDQWRRTEEKGQKKNTDNSNQAQPVRFTGNASATGLNDLFLTIIFRASSIIKPVKNKLPLSLSLPLFSHTHSLPK